MVRLQVLLANFQAKALDLWTGVVSKTHKFVASLQLHFFLVDTLNEAVIELFVALLQLVPEIRRLRNSEVLYSFAYGT